MRWKYRTIEKSSESCGWEHIKSRYVCSKLAIEQEARRIETRSRETCYVINADAE